MRRFCCLFAPEEFIMDARCFQHRRHGDKKIAILSEVTFKIYIKYLYTVQYTLI